MNIDAVILLQTMEYLFTFAAFVGITISIDNFRESQRNIQAIRDKPGFDNGRGIVARRLRRSAAFSIIQYVLLLTAGVTAIAYGTTVFTPVGTVIRTVLCSYVAILIVHDILDMLDRRAIIYDTLHRRQYRGNHGNA